MERGQARRCRPAKAIRHTAVHHLCLQDDDMFSPKYSGGQGFGGGMPYGAMPLPGRPTAVPHPATLAGTPAYQQVVSAFSRQLDFKSRCSCRLL
jgi:hypothetical protein